MRHRMWGGLVAAMALASTATIASAASINVQFGETSSIFGPTPHYTGAAVVGGAADLWNFAGGDFNPDYKNPNATGWGRTISGQALFDSAGSATSVKLSLTTPDAFISLENFAPIFKGTSAAALMDSFVFADGNRLGYGGGEDGPGFVTLSGLKAGEDYRLILLSAGDVVGRATRFTVDGVEKIATPSGVAAFIEGDTYVSFLAHANADGNLMVAFDAASGREGNLNGLQLVDLGPTGAPEPAAWALLIVGFGAAGAALRAQRRRRLA